MANKSQSQASIENEMNCCVMCVCTPPIADKGARYCSNTKSKLYEEVKTPAAHKCEKFIPKVRV